MIDKVTFAELIKSFADTHDITQQKAEKLIRGLFNIVLDDLKKEGKASITNFGSFSLKRVAERTGINPQTKEEIIIPAHNKVSFKPYKALENSVNAEYSDLESKLLGEAQTTEKPKAEIEVPEEKLEEKVPEVNEAGKEEDPFEAVINPELKEEDEEESKELENKIISEEEEIEIVSSEDSIKKEKSSNSAVSWVLMVLLFMIAGTGIWYFFFRDAGNVNSNKKIVFNTPSEVVKPAEQKTEKAQQEIEPAVQTEVKVRIKEVEPLKEPTTSTYTIDRNDWFWVTAEKVYGRSALWPLIFEANFTVDTNPDVINIGKILVVPSIEGSAMNLAKSDYAKLAKATLYASEAYNKAGNTARAAEYLRFAKKYERQSKN